MEIYSILNKDFPVSIIKSWQVKGLSAKQQIEDALNQFQLFQERRGLIIKKSLECNLRSGNELKLFCKQHEIDSQTQQMITALVFGYLRGILGQFFISEGQLSLKSGGLYHLYSRGEMSETEKVFEDYLRLEEITQAGIIQQAKLMAGWGFAQGQTEAEASRLKGKSGPGSSP